VLSFDPWVYYDALRLIFNGKSSKYQPALGNLWAQTTLPHALRRI
jgi:hypothetical protein